MTRPEIGGHDDDGVPEIHGIAEPVRQLTVFKHLQQYIKDVRMGLLDFIEQDHRVRRPADTLRQLPAFFVAHVPRRRANQLRDGMLFHDLRHVEANQRLLRTKQKFRQRPGYFGLSDAGRPKEEEAAQRTQGRLETGAAAANGAGQRRNGFVLADHALVEFRLDTQQFLLFVFLDGGHADAGPARNDFFNVFTRHDAGRGVVQFESFAQSTQIFFFLALFLGIKTRLFELVVGDGRFHAVGDEFHALLDFANFFGNGGLAELHARAGFVDQVDGFVRNKTVWDVAVRKIDGVAERFVRVADSVEFFVALANTLDHLNSLLFVRPGNFYGLEAAFQGAILLDRLAVFAPRRRANPPNFPTSTPGLSNIGLVP